MGRGPNLVTIARRLHLFPSRTQKLSSLALMILGGRLPGKVGRCRLKKRGTDESQFLFCIGKEFLLNCLTKHQKKMGGGFVRRRSGCIRPGIAGKGRQLRKIQKRGEKGIDRGGRIW